MKLLPLVIAVFYPLIQPYWETGPLLSDKLLQPQSLSLMSDEVIQEQAELFKQFSDPAIRSVIVREMAQSNNKTALEAMEALAKTENDTRILPDLLNSMSIISGKGLGKISDSTFFRGLLKSSNPLVRLHAAELLVDKGELSDILHIAELLLQENTASVISGIFTRVNSAKDNHFTESELTKLADAKNLVARANAIRMLARTSHSPENNTALKNALDSNEPLIKISLAEGLAENPDSSAVFLKKLSEDPEIQVRLATAGIVKLTPEKEVILIRLSKDEQSPGIRVRACGALGGTTDNDALDALIVALSDPVKLVREAAKEALTESNPSSSEVLDKVLDKASAGTADSSESIHTLQALAEQGAKLEKFAPVLEKTFDKANDDTIVIDLMAALAAIGSETSVLPILKYTDSENSKVRESVAKTFEHIKDERAFDTLKKLAVDTSQDVQLAAITSISFIENKTFLASLASAVGNLRGSAEVRATACWGLSRFETMSKADMSNLMKLAVMPCIPVPMSPPMYDADNVRVSAILALMTVGKKGDEDAMKTYRAIIERLKNPSDKESSDGIMNSSLEEYIRQIELMEQDKKIEPVQIPSHDVYLNIGRLKEQ